MVDVAYKFRIYPTVKQQKLLNRIFGTVRFVWNFFLAMRRDCYMLWGKSPAYSQCSAELTKLKHTKGYEWLCESDSTALQTVLKNLDDAFKTFFRKSGGYPKFKSKKEHRDSYTSKNNNDSIRFDETMRYIQLPKLGMIRVHVSRPVSGVIYNATVSRTPSGKYFVSVLCHQDEPKLNAVSDKVGGIDLGEERLYTDSEGKYGTNVRALDKAFKKLALEQARLSRKTRGSHSYEKQRIKVARLNERVANIRRDNSQKATTSLMREYLLLGAESLDVKEMIESSDSSDSAKRKADCGWGEFLRELSYKASWYNRIFIQIDQYFPSSQLCSVCGYKNPDVKDLSIRQWECPHCHTHHDRDINAAVNIKNEAMRIYSNSLFSYLELNH